MQSEVRENLHFAWHIAPIPLTCPIKYVNKRRRKEPGLLVVSSLKTIVPMLIANLMGQVHSLTFLGTQIPPRRYAGGYS